MCVWPRISFKRRNDQINKQKIHKIIEERRKLMFIKVQHVISQTASFEHRSLAKNEKRDVQYFLTLIAGKSEIN